MISGHDSMQPHASIFMGSLLHPGGGIRSSFVHPLIGHSSWPLHSSSVGGRSHTSVPHESTQPHSFLTRPSKWHPGFGVGSHQMSGHMVIPSGPLQRDGLGAVVLVVAGALGSLGSSRLSRT